MGRGAWGWRNRRKKSYWGGGGGGRRRSHSPSPGPTQSTSHSVPLSNDNNAADFVGTLPCLIVGVRHYSGWVENGQDVYLVRDRWNEYDRNAIKVLNETGIQIGHIKRNEAALLSKLIDPKVIQVEGKVQTGAEGSFEIPVDVLIYAKPENRAKAIQTLKRSRLSYQFKMEASAMAGSATKTSPISASFTAPPESADSDDSNEGEKDEYMVTVNCQIVGMRFYNESVGNRQNVFLVRDRENIFNDVNSIKVLNEGGSKIGYIKKEQATALSYLIDKKSVRVEGKVLRGADNLYKIPVDVLIFGKAKHLIEIMGYIRNSPLPLKPHAGPSVNNPLSHLTEKKPKGHMDKLFKETLKQQEEGSLMVACDAIKTKLYPHQMIALYWMVQHEEGEYLPPFWTEKKTKGKSAFHSYITDLSSSERPKCIPGGILADDMGLGKTLTMISLIFTNFHDKKPLAKPVPGYVRLNDKSTRKFQNMLGNEEDDCETDPDVGKKSMKVEKFSFWNLPKSMSDSLDASEDLATDENYISLDEDWEETPKYKGKGKGKGKSSQKAREAVVNVNQSQQENTAAQDISEGKVEQQAEPSSVATQEIRTSQASNYEEGTSSGCPPCLNERNLDKRNMKPRSDNLPESKPDDGCPSEIVNREEIVIPPNINTLEPETLTRPNPLNEELPPSFTSASVAEVPDIQSRAGGVFCICKQVNRRGFLMKCSRCQAEAHGRCFNTNRKMFEPIKDQYICSYCQMELQIAVPVPMSTAINLDGAHDDNSENGEPIPSCSKRILPPEHDYVLPAKIPKPEDSSSSLAEDSDNNNYEVVTYISSQESDLDVAMEVEINVDQSPSLSDSAAHPCEILPPTAENLPPVGTCRLVPLLAEQRLPTEPLPRSKCDLETGNANRPPVSITNSTSVLGLTNSWNSRQHNILRTSDPAPSSRGFAAHKLSSGFHNPEIAGPSRPLPEKSDKEITESQKQRLVHPPKILGEAEGRPRATLIVCPMSLISHWVSQVQEHVNKEVPYKLMVHYGVDRAKTVEELAESDIVITTYGTLSSEFANFSIERKSGAGKSNQKLFAVHWLRVVLDEGHMIKNLKTRMFKSAMELKTVRKWIISGTPIQNNLDELSALVLWLQIQPFCDDKALWKTLLTNPMRMGTGIGYEKGMKHLQLLLTSICMRRTKRDQLNGKPLVNLPEKHFYLRRISLCEETKRQYAKLYEEGHRLIEALLQDRNILSQYAHVFALITRLRQFCCHPELLPAHIQEKLKSVDPSEMFGSAIGGQLQGELLDLLKNVIADEVDDDCSICLEPLINKVPVVTQCRHLFCKECMTRHLSEQAFSTVCPLCRAQITKSTIVESVRKESENDVKDIKTNTPSAKVEAVMDELQRIRDERPGEKVVIASQFTSFLSIIQPHLTANKFSFLRLDGGMSGTKRAEVISTFQEGKPEILLLSLKAGGVGLNLIAANHLMLLDPAWNPATEEQCFDRVHRLGQKKEVFIYKFIIEETIEERILILQEKKKDLALGAFGGKKKSASEAREQRINDIKVLIDL